MSEETKMIIIARRDLKLTKGKMAAQVAHAAVTLALRRRDRTTGKLFNRWFDDGQRKVVVYVDSEAALYPLETQAKQAGLTTALIRDAGHTEIPAGTVTVLGIGPGTESEMDEVTGHLKLA